MIDSNDILTLLSISFEDVLNINIINDDKNISFIDIELRDNRTNCPFCLSDNLVIKDYYIINLKNNVIRGKKLYIKIKLRRY